MSFSQKTIQEVKLFIEQKTLLNTKAKVLCAVSGGADSIVMVDILKTLGYEIGIAHCNFKLRGKAADKDEQFVKAYAEVNNIPFYSTCFETEKYAKKHKLSIQMAARVLRYNWFEEIRKLYGYEKIATAHHLNDQIETVLLNLIKGTGISGITGIKVKNEKVVRPLLSLTKETILKYADKQNLKYRTDASNADNKYERNLIRNKIVPLFENINPALLHTFQNNLNHFNEAEQLANYAIQHLKKKLIENRKGNYFISILKLQSQPGWKTLLDDLLVDFDFSHKQTEEVIKMLNSQSGKQIDNANYRLIKDREFLIISEANSENNNEAIVLIENEKQKVKTPFFKLKFEVVKFKGVQHKSPEWFMQLDYHKISFPLTLRKWQQGDYFYPLGMNKKKKISNFLIDEKVSVLDKEQTYVLLSGEHIIAIIGKRIDDRFKVTDTTKKALEIVLKPI